MMASTTISNCPVKEDSSLLPPNHPCLICGQLLEIKCEIEEGAEEDDGNNYNLRHQLQITPPGSGDHEGSGGQPLQYLLKLFEIKLDLLATKWWSCETGIGREKQVPFCFSCQLRLAQLMELERKLEELMEQLRKGKEELKYTLEGSDEAFIRHGGEICEMDKRFYWIRRKLVASSKNVRISLPDRSVDCLAEPLEISKSRTPADHRNSSRRTSCRTAAIKANEKLVSSASPFVLLSDIDRKCAEEHKRGPLIVEENTGGGGSTRADVMDSPQDLDDMDMDIDYNSKMSPQSSDPEFVLKRKRKPMKTAVKKVRKNVPISSRGPPKKKARLTKQDPSSSKISKSKSFEDQKDEDEDLEANPTGIARTDSDADDDFVPSDSEHEKSSSSSEEDDDEDDTSGRKIINQKNQYHVDKATGNIKLFNITLEKLTNNEFGKERYKCSGCSRVLTIKRFKNKKQALRQHVIRVHTRPKKNVYIRHCIDNVTGNFTLLNVTLEKLEEETELDKKKQYQCKTCSKIIVDSCVHYQSLRNHVLSVHTDKFHCKECDKKCKSSSSLWAHMESHHTQGRRKHPCPICGKPFSFRSSLSVHRRTHLGEAEKEELRIKTNTGKSEKSFQCEVCGHICNSEGALRYHMTRHHQTEEEIEKEKSKSMKLCPECGKHVSGLKVHMETAHSTFLQYPCVQCDKRFKSKPGLRSHVKIWHNRVDKFKCSLCPKTFLEKTQFKNHMNVHLNIRPHQCEHCPSSFTQSAHLRRHNKVYHEEGSCPKRPIFVRGPKKKGFGNGTHDDPPQLPQILE